ncbi:formylglycine-generating enzyme family protein [Streptomyces sp. CA-288835]|uniref:formylglycine-generating enzyme family protein n=1 Tax=Streptomyces sp. CA-288835 TaxID=3240069 RepID=UPI003D8AED03
MNSHCCAPGRSSETGASDAASAASEPQPSAPVSGSGTAPGGSRVALPGGTFRMGGEDADANPGDGEGPVREVTVGPFEIDTRCVTNERFAAFVDATGYRTDAERFGWSYVFARFLPGELRKVSPRPEGTPWWCGVQGAYWAAPEGPGSGLDGRWDHPVVHVSWGDALAFCRWEGSRLPTEAEWEYAARGGLDQKRFPWGDELTPGGEHRCNIWQGRFPFRNTAEDGYKGTAPVDAFPPNGFGLFNTSGNVWEWCADWWGTDHGTGPHTDPKGPEQGTARVMRGGSYLCHDSYCNRYRVAARTSNTPDSSVGNLGFRCVRDPAKS